MTVADLLKVKYPNRAEDESFQRREYQRIMGRKPGEPVKVHLTLTSGTRKLTLTPQSGKPLKAGLFKAFIT